VIVDDIDHLFRPSLDFRWCCPPLFPVQKELALRFFLFVVSNFSVLRWYPCEWSSWLTLFGPHRCCLVVPIQIGCLPWWSWMFPFSICRTIFGNLTKISCILRRDSRFIRCMRPDWWECLGSMRFYLNGCFGTFEDEWLHFVFDKLFERGLAFGFFLFQSLKALIELSFSRLKPGFDRPSALLFFIFLVGELALDGFYHIEHFAVPSLFCFWPLKHFFLSLAELLKDGPLLQRLPHLCRFLKAL